MRFLKDGDSLTLEPWRARAFPVVRDLIVNRSAFDRIIQAGGFISAPTGSAPDANAILVPKEAADTAFAQLHASAAAPALPPVRMPLPRYSPARKSAISAFCLKGSLNGINAH